MRTPTILLFLAIGCTDRASLVECADGTVCPEGKTCAPAGGTCVFPEQITACDGLADGEPCELGGAPGTCDRGVCITNLCGNGDKEPEEACDDGNFVGGDGCSADCQKIERCGDRVVDEGENCDDGNVNATDGCDNTCRATAWLATPLVGASSPATSIGLAYPPGVAIDRDGRILIADSANNRIQRIDGTSITTIAGTGVAGSAGDGGPATSAELSAPEAVAVDGLGRIYIADYDNNCVRMIDELGAISTIAGACGSDDAYYTDGNLGDGGHPLEARFAGPAAVAVDGQGRLYIADQHNHAIRRIDGTVIQRVAGSGTGIGGLAGDGGPATSAELNYPKGIALDIAGSLYIADTDNHAIRKLDAPGSTGPIGALRTIAGVLGTPGASGPLLALPASVSATSGVVTIADSGNHRVCQLTSGNLVTVAGDGVSGFAGDAGPGLGAHLAEPSGVATDATGRIVIADLNNHRIRRVDIDAARTITTIAGSGTYRMVGDGGAARSAPDLVPWGVAADAQGNVYIADGWDTVHQRSHDRIRKIDTAGTITTIAGNGDPNSSSLPFPEAVAVDALGRVYFIDKSRYIVWRADPTGVRLIAGGGTRVGDGERAIDTNLSGMRAIALDGTTLYISQTLANGVVRKIVNPDGAAATIETVAGGGTNIGDTTLPLDAKLAYPRGIAFDAQHRLYIADTGAFRIVRVDGTSLVRVAGAGATGSTAEGVPPLTARMTPNSLALDATGNLYYSDATEHRVRRIDRALATVTTFAGAHSRTFGAIGDGGPATGTSNITQLYAPQGIAFDGLGRLLIADRDNYRVRRVELDGTITTIGGPVSPQGMGSTAQAKFADARAVIEVQGTTLVAGGSSGTVQSMRANWVDTLIGRYPHATATGNLARYRATTFGTVAAIAADAASSKLFVVEDNRLHQVATTSADAAAWTIMTLANTTNTSGHADGAAAMAQFQSPKGLHFDATSRTLFVADTGNHVIRAIAVDGAGQPVTTIAGTAGNRGSAGDNGPAAMAKLYAPEAVTRCPNGDLFVADTGGRRVRRIRGGVITSVLGTGLMGAPGEGAPSTDYPVDAPKGLACDAANNLYVASTNTIRQLPAGEQGVVDGQGPVLTIYKSTTNTCLTGLQLVDSETLRAVDQCSGVLVQLRRDRAQP